MIDEKLFNSGLEHFESGNYFEAHEDWETIWLKADGTDKPLLQAMIVLAASFIHKNNNKPGPQKRLLELGLKKLDLCLGASIMNISESQVRKAILKALDGDSPSLKS